MKKLALLCALMIIFLCGCDHLPAFEVADDSSETSSESYANDSDSESSAPAQDSDSSESPAYYDGRIGDTLSSVFFDFTVESVDLMENASVSEGTMMLDLVITIRNTFGQSLPMYYNDFQLQYGEGDYDFCYSVLDDTLPLSMPESYTLKRGESVTYHMYFEVPETATEFSLAYLEIYDDDSTGDVFFIYFERQ